MQSWTALGVDDLPMRQDHLEACLSSTVNLQTLQNAERLEDDCCPLRNEPFEASQDRDAHVERCAQDGLQLEGEGLNIDHNIRGGSKDTRGIDAPADGVEYLVPVIAALMERAASGSTSLCSLTTANTMHIGVRLADRGWDCGFPAWLPLHADDLFCHASHTSLSSSIEQTCCIHFCCIYE